MSAARNDSTTSSAWLCVLGVAVLVVGIVMMTRTRHLPCYQRPPPHILNPEWYKKQARPLLRPPKPGARARPAGMPATPTTPTTPTTTLTAKPLVARPVSQTRASSRTRTTTTTQQRPPKPKGTPANNNNQPVLVNVQT